MKIGIDANEANEKEKVGIGWYSYEILNNIIKVARQKDKQDSVKFAIYLKKPPLSDMPQKSDKVEYEIFGPGALWTQFALPFRLLIQKKDRPGVFLSLSHYGPRVAPMPLIVSVMDLSFERFPTYFRKRDLYQLKSWTASSVKRAAKIITISHFSKKELVSLYKYPREKIEVIYPGLNRDKYGVLAKGDIMKSKAGFKKKYNIKDNFILYAGTIQPRKNIITLVKAYEEIKYRFKDLQLVIAGRKGWFFEETLKRIKDSKYFRDIIHLEYPADGELVGLYNLARLYVLPSFYEGFGMPVIEAMACGCPVIAARTSSLPEIGGKAASYFQPDNSRRLGDLIGEVLTRENKRDAMVKKGFTNIARFSWEKSAGKLLYLLVKTAR